MTTVECSKTDCHEPAEFIVKIHAFTRATDAPIELVLGLQVCKAHPPPIEFLDGSIWDILDTWALNGRHRICDRSLTQIILIPMAGEEGLVLQSMLSNRSVGPKSAHERIAERVTKTEDWIAAHRPHLPPGETFAREPFSHPSGTWFFHVCTCGAKHLTNG